MKITTYLPTLAIIALVIASCVQKKAPEIAETIEVESLISLYEVDSITAKKLTKDYLAEVIEGKRRAYHFDDMTKVITPDEIAARGIRTDTFYVENPQPPHNLEMKVARTIFEPDYVPQIWLKEKWSLNSKGQVIKKDTIAIGPQVHEKLLCWIKLEKGQ